jgi:hypothetical protein
MFRLLKSAAQKSACIAAALAIGIVVASTTTARAGSADVTQLTISKAQSYFQYGPFDFVADPFFFEGYAEVTPAYSGSVLSGAFAAPDHDYLSLTVADAGLYYQGTFNNPGDWNAAFPAGRYWFDLVTARDPLDYVDFVDLIERYPERPRIANDFYSGVIQLDYRRDFTYRWAPFAGFSFTAAQPSAIQFELIDFFDRIVFRQRTDQPITSITIAGGTLGPGFYIGRVFFGNSDVETDNVTKFQSISATGAAFLISAIDGPPVIQPPLTATVTVGQLFAYVIKASNAPGSFTAANLPPGIVSDTSFGWIAGFPTQAGTYQIPITASNTMGSGSAVLTLTVVPDQPLAIKSSTGAAGAKGTPFKFQVLVTGATSSARVAARGLPGGLQIDAVSGVISGTPTEPGRFPVTLTVTDGNASATGALDLAVSDDPAFPAIKSSESVNVAAGQNFFYKCTAVQNTGAPGDDTTYRIAGDLPKGLTFDGKAGVISGTYGGSPATGGDPTVPRSLSGGVIVGNIQLFANNSRGTATIPLVFFTPPVGAVNISTRLALESGENGLFAGFFVTGNAPKKLILRAIGPSLRANGGRFPGALEDPVLELHAGDGTLLTTNDNWRSDHADEIIDSTIAPTDDREAAIIGAFDPGPYTAIVRGKNDTRGVAVVELYDLGTASLNTSSTAKLAQISTRGRVQTGENIMIGGFIINGTTSKVIVRAIGPSLAKVLPGALMDTTLELHDGNGGLLMSNDDWRSTQEQEIINTSVPPKDDHESAIVATLGPGNYTAVVRGKNESTGVALVEVYALQ